MANEMYTVGTDIWIPCDVQSGSPPNEPQCATVQVGDAEWFGFVNAADLRRQHGLVFVRATIIGVGSKGYVVQLRGSSMGPEAIQAPQEVFQRHGAIPATIALELFNHGDVAVELRPNQHFLSQLLLIPLSTTLTERDAYGAKPEHIFAKQTKPVPTE